MKSQALLLVGTLLLVALHPVQAADLTPTGIPVDTPWKHDVFEFASKNVVHPSWGLAHSERDYQVTREIAQREAIPVDLDVLFAAAFLHDLGGIGSFARPGVDHAVRSAELAEPLLRSWGFPMDKWLQVKDMILGHTYYGPTPALPLSYAFRDADIIDFLGDIGVARIFAVTEEPGRASQTLKPPIDLLKNFLKEMPSKIHFASSREIANRRISELRAFLRSIYSASLGGTAL